jgi:hypothetical protein
LQEASNVSEVFQNTFFGVEVTRDPENGEQQVRGMLTSTVILSTFREINYIYLQGRMTRYYVILSLLS